MPKAVRFEKYGGIDVLQVVDVDRPVPQAGQVLIQVKAAGINPGEAGIREGWFAELFPATFPSGEGSDFAGVVVEVGAGVEGFAVGDEVIGFTHNRASHAEFVVAEVINLTAKPPRVSWEQAGALFVAGRWGLTLTLFLIGSGISRAALRQVGWRPMLHAVLLWLSVALASLYFVRLGFIS